jgi:hypothetical protein
VAVALAVALPAGADVCAVARPGAVAASRRGLIRPLSQAGPFGWLSGLSVTAQAWASRTGRGERRAAVALLRVHDPEEGVRAALAAQSPMRLAWDGERCEPPDCHGFRARFIDDRTVRIEQGRWVDGADGPEGAVAGVERRCLDLAIQRPEALEVAVQRGDALVSALHHRVPRQVETILRPVAGGVVLERHRWMPTREAAVASQRAAMVDGGPPSAELATDAWTHRRGRRVISGRHYAFEDLALAVQDLRRLRRAHVEQVGARRRSRVRQVDMEDLEAVREALRRGKRILRQATGDVRRSVAADLRQLLEGALAVHPDETSLGHDLVRILLDELGDPEAAARVVDQALPRVPDDERSLWRRLLREAFAHRGAEALAPLLVDHGVVPEGRAEQAAHDVAALVGGGRDYEWIEGAWQLAESLGARRMPLHPIGAVELPLESLVATLHATGSLVTRDEGPHALYVLARGPGVRPPERGTDGCLPFRDPRGALTCVSAVHGDRRPSDGQAAWPFGLGQGAFELTARLVPLPGAPGRRARVLRWAGHVQGEVAHVTRASAPAHGAAWSRIHRYLALPLASPAEGLFPPPVLSVDAEDPAHVAAMLRRAEDEPDIRCASTGRLVRCELLSVSVVEAPARALLPLVRPFLGAAVDTLWHRPPPGR